MVWRPILIFSAALGLGWLAARVLSAPASPTPAAPSSSGPPTRPAAPIPRAGALRCVDVRAQAPSCPGQDARLWDCEAALSALDVPAPRQVFPEVPEREQPGPWTEGVEAALRDCEVPAELVATDCQAYPCAAALRVSATDEPAARAALTGCAPLSEQGIEFDRVEVHCPDGHSEWVMVGMTMDRERWNAILPAGSTPSDTVAWAIAYGQRIESTLQLWDCNVAAP